MPTSTYVYASERRAELADGVLEVGRLDEPGADRCQRQRGDEHERLHGARYTLLAGDRAGQQQSRANQWQRLHAPDKRAPAVRRLLRDGSP